MPAPLNLSVGRVRVTRAVSPAQAGYIQSIRAQMAVIKQNLLKVIDYVDNITPDALVYGLKPIYDESQRLVPVDTGKLKASGFLETRKTARGASAVLGYGRYGRPNYAAYVHERLDLRHASPTQAKFLEAAVANRIDDFRRRIVLYYQKQTGITK